MMDAFDPLLRRSSVDASLQRLALNPFASLARAKNSALYGPGFGVAIPGAPSHGLRHHHQLNRLPYNYHPLHHQRRGVSGSIASLPQHASMRRLSMDSRPPRFSSISRTHQTPSPSPLTPYNAVIRASLPDHLYTISSRTVASPIPGPLPSPGFSFGAASTPPMASPSSGDSERNSPDSVRSFTFRSGGEDEDYDAYTRFGSIASIATSESSINSSYYGEIGGPGVDHHSVEERRDSWYVTSVLLPIQTSRQGAHSGIENRSRTDTCCIVVPLDISPTCFPVSMSIIMLLLRICTARWALFRLMSITRSPTRPMASRWLVPPVICIFIINNTSNNLGCSSSDSNLSSNNPRKRLIRRPLRRCRLEGARARARKRKLDLRLLVCRRMCRSPLRASWPLLWRINLNNWWVDLGMKNPCFFF